MVYILVAYVAIGLLLAVILLLVMALSFFLGGRGMADLSVKKLYILIFAWPVVFVVVFFSWPEVKKNLS